MEFKLNKRVVLKDIPSASGVEYYKNHIYITADNSPWLFKLNEDYELVDQFPIYSLSDLKDQAIPKKLKPDFEAMTLVEEEAGAFFYIFGSGSKSPQRNVLIKINADNPFEHATYDLGGFYDLLKKTCGFSDENFNIEAAAFTNGQLLLLNRATNDIVTLAFSDLLAFLSNPLLWPEITSRQLTLPVINGLESRFSGCTAIPGLDKILFTASVENTTDWIADGQVLGSFVGVIEMSELLDGAEPLLVQVEKDTGTPLKIESVAIQKASGNSWQILMVSDNDEGVSELLVALLRA